MALTADLISTAVSRILNFLNPKWTPEFLNQEYFLCGSENRIRKAKWNAVFPKSLWRILTEASEVDWTSRTSLDLNFSMQCKQRTFSLAIFFMCGIHISQCSNSELQSSFSEASVQNRRPFDLWWSPSSNHLNGFLGSLVKNPWVELWWILVELNSVDQPHSSLPAGTMIIHDHTVISKAWTLWWSANNGSLFIIHKVPLESKTRCFDQWSAPLCNSLLCL